jgi:tRNA nucleotidyltransferase (CCA-adding enzyme)
MQINIPQQVEYILQQLNNNGFEAYIVGGCVRDSLLNREPKDWDITTNATPLQVKNIFEKTIDTGIQHGTVTVMIDKEGFEVTTYRIDGNYSDNRRPDNISFTTSLKEDLARRDFTINAMAYNHREGLVDYFNGIVDLENKIIKCVGNSTDRFNEDGLRILRAIRFMSQLGFFLNDKTSKAILECHNNLKNISIERIRDEFNKILISDYVIKGLNSLFSHNLYNYIIPEIIPCIGFEQNNNHHDKTVYQHILSVIESVPNKLELRLSAFLHDIGKPKCYTADETGEGHFYQHHIGSEIISREILTRLKYDNKTIEKVCILVREHMSRYDFLRNKNTKKFINRVGIENLNDLFELQIADIKGCAKEYQNFDNVLKLKEECQRILNEQQPLSIKDLKINGYDLMNLGYKEGRDIGNKLKELLELVLESPELNTKEELMKFI